MKKIPYAQMILGLDQLFMGGQIKDQEEAEKRADTIDAYLEACGYTWDDVLEGMTNEESTLRDSERGSGEDVRKTVPRGRPQSN